MRKSTTRTHNYRPGGSTRHGSPTTFRAQMADYAKGDALRELRAQKRLSREKVAAAIDVSTKTVYSWENSGGIKIENARKLAGFYGVEDVETLITRDSHGGDQLDRIEIKLDAIIVHLGVELSDDDLARMVAQELEAHAEQDEPKHGDSEASEREQKKKRSS